MHRRMAIKRLHLTADCGRQRERVSLDMQHHRHWRPGILRVRTIDLSTNITLQ